MDISQSQLAEIENSTVEDPEEDDFNNAIDDDDVGDD